MEMKVRARIVDHRVEEYYSEEFENLISEIEVTEVGRFSNPEMEDWHKSILHKLTDVRNGYDSPVLLDVVEGALNDKWREYLGYQDMKGPEESPEETTPPHGKHLYKYEGPIHVDGRVFKSKWTSYIHAKSPDQALNLLRSKAAKVAGLDSNYIHKAWVSQDHLIMIK